MNTSLKFRTVLICSISIPAGLFFSYLMGYDIFSFFFLALFGIFMFVHFLFLGIWIFLHNTKPFAAFVVVLSGYFFRMIFFISFGIIFFIRFPSEMEGALLLFLITLFSFIFFEIIALITLPQSLP